MKFRTQLPKSTSSILWNYQHSYLTFGSCFANNIGAHLEEHYFKTLQNPSGILYTPIALANILSRYAKNNPYEKEDFFHHDSLYSHFEQHSELSRESLDEALQAAEAIRKSTHQELKQADHIVITLGTAWSFFHKKSNIHVGNNHRLPKSQFDRTLLDVQSTAHALGAAIENIQEINPKANFLISVSPVRHLRDGLHENNLSKSVLHLIAKTVVDQNNKVEYFPAYELLIDDLRDYRFYNEDMAHPSASALTYIFKYLKATHFDKDTLTYCEMVEDYLKLAAHTPRKHRPAMAQRHFDRLKEKRETLIKEYPHLAKNLSCNES